jgi:hypothetical protein
MLDAGRQGQGVVKFERFRQLELLISRLGVREFSSARWGTSARSWGGGAGRKLLWALEFAVRSTR